MKKIGVRALTTVVGGLALAVSFQNCGHPKGSTSPAGSVESSTSASTSPTVGAGTSNEPAASCSAGALTACMTSTGLPGYQTCTNGSLGACTAVPSSCGGTKPYGSVVRSSPDDGSGAFSGLRCGQTAGVAKLCHSCSAQWIYPSGRPIAGATMECRCL